MHLPFGGTKDTGNGHREAGQAALDVFTEWKSIYVDYSGKLQRAQIDNVSVNRKLVVFVPPEALDAVRDALFAAGAGRIGDYERCSWYTEGTGTFRRRLPGAEPVGRRGRGGGARRRAPARDGVPGGARRTRSSRRSARRTRTRSPPSTSTRSL